MKRLLPNLVIGGVRKCGTTSLFDWLQNHPDVCASSHKETAYLMDRDSPYFVPECNVHDHGLEGYAQFFPDYSGQLFVLEATTRYLYQETALRVFSQMRPQPHVIFVLREPAARLYSAFRYARNNRGSLKADTSLGAFVAALHAGEVEPLLHYSAESVAARSMRREIAEMPKEIRFGNYAELLRPWKERFDEEHLHVYLFEELKDRPRRFTMGLARDVGLDPGFYEDYEFQAKNKTVLMRSHWAHRLVRGLAPLVPRSHLTRSIYRTYLNVQSQASAPLPPDEAAALDELRTYYAPYNERLAAEYGLDLAPWS